jgi:acetyltransferase-like isoleucine patch superfamily enzyme
MFFKKVLKHILIIWLRRRLGSLGKNSYLNPFGTYLCSKRIHVGNDVFIGRGAIISASEGIRIGSGVTIGPEFMVMGGDHNFRSVGHRIFEQKEGGDNKPIMIEDDVWIGARVLILKGVRVGEGAIVGAGAVVTKSIPPYTIWGGNPARKIGTRFTRDELIQHLRLLGSKYRIEDLEENFPS